MSDLLHEAIRRFARVPPPAGVLQGLQGIELAAGLAYDAAALAAPAGRRAMYEKLAEHERDHARVVATLLGALAAKQPRRPTDDDVAALVPGVADAATPHAVLAAAERFEVMELAAIEETMAQMTEAKLLQSLLTISAADGQHGVALRLELGEEPVPSAFS